MVPENGSPQGRLVQLDVLRGLAVLRVAYGHNPFRAHPTLFAGKLLFLLEPLYRFSWTGVDLCSSCSQATWSAACSSPNCARRVGST
jgi:hypothetical protein